jgi:Cu-Zn family superoxide dismutase
VGTVALRGSLERWVEAVLRSWRLPEKEGTHMGGRVRTTILAVLAALMLAMLVLAQVASAQQAKTTGGVRQPLLFAWARIINVEGDPIGAVAFTQHRSSDEVRVFVFATGLQPGKHGTHIHSVGQCDPNSIDPATGSPFYSAGTHFNPQMNEHGLQNPQGPHAGDLPNLKVGPAGVGFLRAKDDRITLRKGQENSLFDGDGSAIVIHENRDDQMTDPTGNSGARIACGVIRRAQ